ncbi:MAG: HD domain-containing protein [Candidatus Hydrogenedentes bacterium]|nr:HD domain-containing protein [Candidatus Hydrogenedentota bacterium]
MFLEHERVVKAFSLAQEIHKSQIRKGSSIPYVSHLLMVAGKVLEEGGDEDQFIAGLLHDAVEDQGGMEILVEIESSFGLRVARIVSDCSDSFTFPKKPWKERKEYFIQKCQGLPEDSKLVVACDKWHNLYCILMGYYTEGENIWRRFNGNKDGTLWYYGEVIRALSCSWEGKILWELQRLYKELVATGK